MKAVLISVDDLLSIIPSNTNIVIESDSEKEICCNNGETAQTKIIEKKCYYDGEATCVPPNLLCHEVIACHYYNDDAFCYFGSYLTIKIKPTVADRSYSTKE